MKHAKPDQGDERGAAALPAGRGPGVQVGRVDDPGDERPGLLGVPAPVAAPRVLGPDRAGDDREGPQREREGDRCGRRLGRAASAAAASRGEPAGRVPRARPRSCDEVEHGEHAGDSAKAPLETIAAATWMTSQYERSAGMSGPASDVEHGDGEAERQQRRRHDEDAEAAQRRRRRPARGRPAPRRTSRRMENSYMLPHGARPAAMPRRTIAGERGAATRAP